MAGLLDLFAELGRIPAPVVLATPLAPPGPPRILAPDGDLAFLAPEGAREFLEAARSVLASGRSVTVPGAGGPVLLERVVPGRLPPWLHFCAQHLAKGSSCVLALVARVEGGLPYAVGDRYGYDAHNHGLLPMDGRFSLELQRACQRAREAGRPIRERFPLPGGALELNLDPLGP